MKKLIISLVFILAAGCSTQSKFINVPENTPSKNFAILKTENSNCFIKSLSKVNISRSNPFKSLFENSKINEVNIYPGLYSLKLEFEPPRFYPIISNIELKAEAGHEYEIFSDIYKGRVFFYIVDKTSKKVVAGGTPY